MGVAAMDQGLFARLQVAHLPFERNWQHLAMEPAHFFLEVGANNFELERKDLDLLLSDRAGGFLISFEPLLDKYGHLLSFRRDQYFVNLGLQHPRALALPYAVDACPMGQAVFHVTPVDGCSSLLVPAEQFQSRNQESLESGRGTSWPKWVEQECSVLKERRVVPCVSLRTVLGDWLQGRPVARVKVDAQGMDLQVVRSAGDFVTQLLFVKLEVQSLRAAPLYEGQVFCPEVLSSMKSLGFVLADTSRRESTSCNSSGAERDLDFIRKELRPSWRMFYKEYFFCEHYAAAGECGGPYCISPFFGVMVNRSGACSEQVMDRIDFGPNATGMVMLRMSDECRGRVDAQGLPDESSQSKSLRIGVYQGSVSGRRLCPVQTELRAGISLSLEDSNQSNATWPKMHVMRFRIGRGDERDFIEMAVLLPGILNLGGSAGRRDIEKLIQVAYASSTPVVLWPDSCEVLRASAQSVSEFYELAGPHRNLCSLTRRG
ncbi:unnamed protein product [Symbiodinium necroappetens]|uniref:Methyltransferase FkbM domain-containing protein n=1 Tax=Symbiodinium necroappetens TaxID=1628268 RepID=A0A812URG6_9DINO|nr:unnamed protein product [Symbiodinium necroappetens]